VNDVLRAHPMPAPVELSEAAPDGRANDEMAREAVASVDLDVVLGMLAWPEVEHLASVTVEMTESNRLLQVSHRLVAAHVARWLDAIRLPLESDKAFEHAAREVWKEVIAGNNFFEFALRPLRTVGAKMFFYAPKDVTLFLDRDVSECELEKTQEYVLPVVENRLPEFVLESFVIDHGYMRDCVRPFGRVSAELIQCFEISDRDGIAPGPNVMKEAIGRTCAIAPLKKTMSDEMPDNSREIPETAIPRFRGRCADCRAFPGERSGVVCVVCQRGCHVDDQQRHPLAARCE
jgi:hypothetical protein